MAFQSRPASFYASVQQQGATASTTATSTANVTITGMSITVVSPDQSAVFRVEIDSDVSVTAGTTNIIEMLVDGVSQTLQIVTGGSGRQPGHKTWMITGLTQGNHTFTARHSNTAAATSATVLVTNSVMTVTRIS